MPKCDFNKFVLLCNFIEITLWLGCSPVNLLHIFRTPLAASEYGLMLISSYLLTALVTAKNIIMQVTHILISINISISIYRSH